MKFYNMMLGKNVIMPVIYEHFSLYWIGVGKN